jgi:alcohol dehydrogenase class IV
MSFMLALPKISPHGAGAIGDMIKLVAGKRWGKALIVTDGYRVKKGLLDSLFAALDEQQISYHLFDKVLPNPTETLADPCAPCNPRTASRDEVRELYLEAL